MNEDLHFISLDRSTIAEDIDIEHTTIKYKLIGFTMSYGQKNPSTYYYMVDNRLKIKIVKRCLENWYSWMKVINIVEPPRDDTEHYILGYFTRKDKDEQTE